MFHFRLLNQSRQHEKSATQSPNITPNPSTANDALLRRIPLTPLDPQYTHPPTVDIHDQMLSTSASSAFPGYNPSDILQDSDSTRVLPGRPIVSRTALDDLVAAAPPTRRRSIPSHTSTGSRPPHLPSLRPPRRSVHSPTSSVSSSSRTSVSSDLSLPSALSSPAPPTILNLAGDAGLLGPSDDIYSGLSAFSFGTAPVQQSRSVEPVSPFTVPTPSTADHTPRPSFSSTSTRKRTPRVQTQEIDQVEGAGDDDEDEEEMARQTRAKMRAIDDGTRRPSLPINALPGVSDAPSPPRTTAEGDTDVDLDTDVEFEGAQEMDTASVHTFGGRTEYYPLKGLSQPRPAEDREDEDVSQTVDRPCSPVTFAHEEQEEYDDGFVSSPPPSRQASVPASTGTRAREDSEITITARRRVSRASDIGDIAEEHVPPPVPEITLQCPPPAETLESRDDAGQPATSTAYDGFNLDYILEQPDDSDPQPWGDFSSRRLSESITPWDRNSVSSGRRSSQTTMSEDAFTRHYKKVDHIAEVSAKKFMIAKEKADSPTPTLSTTRTGRAAIHEIWRSPCIGRFKVEKQWTKRADPDKPISQRINVRHQPDPFLNRMVSGPHSIVHRHSRTIAVQAHYYSTRTTSQLNAHGHLSDRSERERNRPEEKSRWKSSKRPTTADSGQTTSGSTVASSSKQTLESDVPRKHRVGPSPPTPVSPTSGTTAFSATSTSNYAPSISTATLSVRESMDSRSPATSLEKERPSSPYPATKDEEDDESDDLDDYDMTRPKPAYQRASHEEAFGTMDTTAIDSYHRHNDHHSKRGIFFAGIGKLRKPTSTAPHSTQAITPVPWVTMNHRDQLEVHERTVGSINDSFSGVGLLPMQKSSHTKQSKSKVPTMTEEAQAIFDNIPADSLYMILPLWADSTDPESTKADWGLQYTPETIALEDRRFLIVHFLDHHEGEDGQKHRSNKSRSKSSSAKSSTPGIPQQGFRLIAQYASYSAFAGSGVRLPSEGLAVLGSMSEAVAYPASQQHSGPISLGRYSGKSNSVLLDPQGLAAFKLVHCPKEADLPPPDQEEVADQSHSEMFPTPLGAAVMELICLACFALTFARADPPSNL
ncbi:uncharacterized protein BXZ73DRAFT_90366 [Epithele typhae]|uniref:uncharacterized protein n=1 Tax=Epithele typhae TaxID=378194 RepID=UPI0020072A42|nr:uncharacterized protein BXZ73DRAFT_90366 [Epithele typhae]KAH9929501.1 hypothetical protein BXZ73DRAFT_90366 [Epithele typhae]